MTNNPQDMIANQKDLQKCRKDLLQFVNKYLMPHKEYLKGNRHFNEWISLPLNYWRYMEIPITHWYFSLGNLTTTQSIIDIGSPKLLALYLSATNPDSEIIVSDISDYFVSDFEEFKKLLNLGNMKIKIIDGRSMEFKDNSIEQVFSVSVLEHIPEDGDSKCAKEIGRILKPGGVATFTLPYAQDYCEEYLEGIKTYWSDFSVENNGKVFFQRRYTWDDIEQRIIKPSGLKLKSMILIAEKPIKKAGRYFYNGKIVENCNYIENSKEIKMLSNLMRRIGLSQQWIHSYYSRRYHYFTYNKKDQNALCIAFQMQK